LRGRRRCSGWSAVRGNPTNEPDVAAVQGGADERDRAGGTEGAERPGKAICAEGGRPECGADGHLSLAEVAATARRDRGYVRVWSGICRARRASPRTRAGAARRSCRPCAVGSASARPGGRSRRHRSGRRSCGRTPPPRGSAPPVAALSEGGGGRRAGGEESPPRLSTPCEGVAQAARCPESQAAATSPSAATTSSACVAGFTSCNTFATVPSGATTNVVLLTPM
jgi:hypothetical protein